MVLAVNLLFRHIYSVRSASIRYILHCWKAAGQTGLFLRLVWECSYGFQSNRLLWEWNTPAMSHQCPLVGVHRADEAIEGAVRPRERHSFTLCILCVTEEQLHHYLPRVAFNTLVNVKPWADANAIRRGGKLYIRVILKHSFKAWSLAEDKGSW